MTSAAARDLVDRYVSWMAGAGRPSPQRGNEADGAEATFLVNGTQVVVYAADTGEVELYGFEPDGTTSWAYTLEIGQDLLAADRERVVATLDAMGAQVRFPAPTWRTRWQDPVAE